MYCIPEFLSFCIHSFIFSPISCLGLVKFFTQRKTTHLGYLLSQRMFLVQQDQTFIQSRHGKALRFSVYQYLEKGHRLRYDMVKKDRQGHNKDHKVSETQSGAILEDSRGDQETQCSHEQNLDIGCVSGVAQFQREVVLISRLLQRVQCTQRPFSQQAQKALLTPFL